MNHKITMALAVGCSLAAMALADPGDAHSQPSSTVTVDGTDYPVCAVEDCSDQPNQIGVWTNSDGIAFLSLGEYSLIITP